MLELLRFYSCVGHNGDIHFSREFIKHFITTVPANKYIYEHDRSQRCILDIPSLEYIKKRNPCKQNRLWDFANKQLNINTWIGCRELKYLGNLDRINPFGGAFIFANYHMFSDVIYEVKKIGIHIPPLKHVLEYIPTIDYKYYKTTAIDKFVEAHPSTKILVCNGPCMSGQIKNFSFKGFIEELAKDKKLTVITTERTDVAETHYTGDIIKISDCDLNEISYLSRFCKVIVGRGSGPYCFSEVRDNVYDNNKRMISISRKKDWAFWYHNPKIMRWSNNFHNKNLTDVFYKALAELIKLI